MQIMYEGVHAEGVDINDIKHVDRLGKSFELLDVQPGKPVEVPDQVAKRLLQQVGNWRTAETPAQRKAREKAEADLAEQEAAVAEAVEKAAADARKRVAAEQAKRDKAGS